MLTIHPLPSRLYKEDSTPATDLYGLVHARSIGSQEVPSLAGRGAPLHSQTQKPDGNVAFGLQNIAASPDKTGIKTNITKSHAGQVSIVENECQ